MRIDVFLKRYTAGLSEIYSERAFVDASRNTDMFHVGIQRHATGDQSCREVANFKVDANGDMVDVEPAFDALARDWQRVQNILK